MSETGSSAQELIDKLAGLAQQVNTLLQDSFFDNWALRKQIQMERKLASMRFERAEHVFLGSHLATARPIAARHYHHLPADFLDSPPQQIPPNSVFLLLNNDIAPRLAQYLAYVQAHPEALFVAWDWDSQHWIQMSAILAMNSDFYVPGTSENVSLLAQFSPHILGPVFVGVHQWTRRFLAEQMPLLLEPRLDTPLGQHARYPQYPRRNRAIATVSPTYPTVGFADNTYKQRSELDNLAEWARHKTHWIMPVMAGVPIRVFNALAAGGIPILPSFYRNLPEIAVLGDTPLYYEVGDLIEARRINEAAVARFDAAGESGLLARVADAMQHHHVDLRCEQILGALERAVDRNRRHDRSHDEGYLGTRDAP
jgi:hypothetical protein